MRGVRPTREDRDNLKSADMESGERRKRSNRLKRGRSNNCMQRSRASESHMVISMLGARPADTGRYASDFQQLSNLPQCEDRNDILYLCNSTGTQQKQRLIYQSMGSHSMKLKLSLMIGSTSIFTTLTIPTGSNATSSLGSPNKDVC